MNTIKLKPGERIESLQRQGLRIIQQEKAFRFGIDAVLLANFANVKTGSRICDAGAGSGILSFLLHGRAENLQIDAIEIDDDAVDRMRRSVLLNGLEHAIRIYETDLRYAYRTISHKFDMFICNPPYHEKTAACLMKEEETMARSEQGCTFIDVAFSASRMLRNRGKMITMCPARRMFEMTHAMQQHNIHVKRMRLVRSFINKPPYLCLLEGVLQANPGVVIEPILTIYQSPDVYTQEVNDIFNQGEQA